MQVLDFGSCALLVVRVGYRCVRVCVRVCVSVYVCVCVCVPSDEQYFHVQQPTPPRPSSEAWVMTLIYSTEGSSVCASTPLAQDLPRTMHGYSLIF